MKKWSLRIINYLTGCLLLSTLHCLVVALVNGGSTQTFLYSMVYFPIVILMSESQKQAKYFWQFAVCGVLSIVLIRITYRESFEQTLATVLTLVAIFAYFYARAKKTECFIETPAFYFLGLYFVIWFLERQYPSELLEKYMVIGAGLYCLLCMYKTNIDEILQFIDLNENLERFPEKRLLKNNLLMMGFQTAVVGIGMGIAMSIGADGIYDKIVGVVRRFFTWLLSFLESEEQYVESEITDESAMMHLVEASETSAFMEILLKILDFLSWVLVIGLVVFAIYKLLKKIYQLYLEFDMNSVENGDEIEKIYTVQTREEKRKLKKQRSENLRWDRSPNTRIRKYYKKRVLRDLKEVPKASMTPKEIEKGIVMPDGDREIFHNYYEKARYGNVACTKEEMENYLKI